MSEDGEPLLSVTDLVKYFPIKKGIFSRTVGHVKAVDGVSFTLERGLLQVSGLRVTYDTSQPEGQRLASVEFDGNALADTDRLTVAAPGFLAEGGDLYTMFAESEAIRSAGTVTDVVTSYLAQHEVVAVPPGGRQVNIETSARPTDQVND